MLVEVRTLTLSVTGSVLIFTKYTAQPEAHIPVYVHMHLYRGHINIFWGGSHEGRTLHLWNAVGRTHTLPQRGAGFVWDVECGTIDDRY